MADQVQESSRFQAIKNASLNALVNNQSSAATWKPDIIQKTQAMDALTNMEVHLQEGILLNFTQQRIRELEKTVAKTCYNPKNDLNFLEAQKCEEYHYKNDYKLNMIQRFVGDHSIRLIRQY